MAVDGEGAAGGRQLRLLNDARHTVAILQTRFRGLGTGETSRICNAFGETSQTKP